MAQKRPSQRHGSKYLASASPMDHARHAFLPRPRDTGILDSLGRFFGGDRGVPKRGSGKVSSGLASALGSLQPEGTAAAPPSQDWPSAAGEALGPAGGQGSGCPVDARTL